MKSRFRPPHWLPSILGCSLSLASCASFQNQTGELEPHGRVTIVKRDDFRNERGRVKSLDGLPVTPGRTYRVRPGTHEVTVEFTETVTETADPMSYTLFGSPSTDEPADVHLSPSGGMSVTGQQPYSTGTQPVRLSVENRRTRSRTIPLTVKAGRHYELDGSTVMEVPSPAR